MMEIVLYRENLENYKIAMNLIKTMQNLGILSGNDLNKMGRVLRKKYSIKPSSIYVDDGLNS